MVHEQGLRTTLNLHLTQWRRQTRSRFLEVATWTVTGNHRQHPLRLHRPQVQNAYFKYLHHPKERQGIDFWWMDWQQGEETKIPRTRSALLAQPSALDRHGHNPDRCAGKRPLVFSRWGGLGNHRYQVGFSGDTFCNWASLAFQPYFTATAATSGTPYWSHDIGGTNRARSIRSCTHAGCSSACSAPSSARTSKNEAAERRIYVPARKLQGDGEAFRFRYELIPYIYTMARKCHDTALPLCRPLYYEWPELDEAYNHPGQYMFGDDLLVAPITNRPTASPAMPTKRSGCHPGAGSTGSPTTSMMARRRCLCRRAWTKSHCSRGLVRSSRPPPYMRTQSISDDTITRTFFPESRERPCSTKMTACRRTGDNGEHGRESRPNMVGENYTATIHPATGELRQISATAGLRGAIACSIPSVSGSFLREQYESTGRR
ncbi:MAG: glycoside hydrolase family 31 protein [Phycisphaerae bacterium]